MMTGYFRVYVKQKGNVTNKNVGKITYQAFQQLFFLQ
jgi:hypothetical protein